MAVVQTFGTKKRRGGRTRRHRPSRKIEMAVRRQLLEVVEELSADIEVDKETILTGTPIEVNRVLDRLQVAWRERYGPKADRLAAQWAEATNSQQKREYQETLANALGVDYTIIFDDPIVKEAADVAATYTAGLIKNIPEKYIQEIKEAVLLNYQQLPLPDGQSLAERLESLYGINRKRALFIAQDQTSKLHSVVTQARDQELGIEEYIWRTSEDARVVGNPSGLYPIGSKGHGNHYERNGKTFRWDKPPSDGHPGWPYRCRCTAEAVIDWDKINAV